jgi:hypothetical protein
MSSEFRRQASLVLNVVLAVTVVVLALHKLNRASAPSAVEASPGKMTNETPVFTKQPKLPKLPRYTDMASASDRRRWMVDQLRAMGVPNDVLALVAQVDREVEWDSRFEACSGDMNKLERVQLEKDMSKDAEMRAALGEEGFKQWDTKYMLWEALSKEVKTTASEAEAIYAMKKKLQQLKLDTDQARLNGTMDDREIDAAYAKAYSEYNQQMKSLLGDERYAKSQFLDYDFVAGNLRASLAKGGVNPTDSQFQELFKVNQQFDDAQSKLDKQVQSDPSSVDFLSQYKALNDARDQEYRRVLGDSAFDALQKSQSPNYSQMKKYETYWGLDDSKIDYVYNTMKQYQNSVFDYQAQARALQAQGQSADAINNKLEQLAAQTQQTLQNYLGQDSYNRLQGNRVLQFYQRQTYH